MSTPIAKLTHPDMIYRFLGNSGLRVSVISFGSALTLGGHVDEALAYEIIKAAYDAGVNFFDTAESYSAGRAEVVLGKAIRHFDWDREDLVISTKIYWGQREDGSSGINDVGLSRKHVLAGMKKSLKRLQMDYVDIIYAHRADKHTPMEEVVRAFNHLIQTGQALYWGTSEWSSEEITDAWRIADKLGLIGPITEQPQYNMISRQRVESEYLPLYRKYKLGLTVYSPLRRGILTGKYNGGEIPEGSRVQKEGSWYRDEVLNGAEMLKKVERLALVAAKLPKDASGKGWTQGQLALAWVIKNPNVSSAIIGATNIAQIEENIRSVQLVPLLTDDVVQEIEEILGNKPDPENWRF